MSPDALSLSEPEGTIANVSDGENLPAGWMRAPLGSLGAWVGGGTPSKSVPAYWANGSIPWVSPKDMKSPIIRGTEDRITEAAVARSAAKFIPPGSVLMVMRSGILRHTFPVAVNADRVTVNQDLRALLPAGGINPVYVAHYLRSAQLRVLQDCSKDGTTVQSVEVAALERFQVPIAPSAEQRRIVARIDELFAEIAEGEAALERARQGLDTWRRALLKAAVTGELTREWREANRPTETAADLLARIRAERLASATGQARARRASAVEPFDAAILRELPEGWLWVSVQELFSWSSGDFLPSKSMRHGAIPVFGGNGIAGYHDGWLVKEPTIVIGRVGFYCGCVHLTEEPAWITDNAIYAKNMPSGCEPTFLKLVLESADIPRLARGGAQPFVNQKLLNSIYVPFCSSIEQKEISIRYHHMVQLWIEIEKQMEAERVDCTKLRQSILKAAFEGRLVPQDPRDEPAAALLARFGNGGPSAPVPRRKARRRADFS